MKIILNGTDSQCDDDATIQSLIETQQLTNKRIAVEVNLEVIPRSQFDSHRLHEGDKVEIVHAIGGG